MIPLIKNKEIKNFIRAETGPLTRDIVQQPGKFGLGRIPQKLTPNKTTNMVCGFCSTGCGLNVHLHDSQAINLSPTTEYPVNLGMACPKGWEALTPLDSKNRATTPYLKINGKLIPVTWDKALTEFTTQFKKIQKEHGNESVAFLSTGQIPSEEMFYLGALTKFGMNILHGDGNTRQCMATAVVAYKQSFGFDAPPYSYTDFEISDTIILVGANPCISHPIMWERIYKNKNNPNIIVVDPRKTETAMAAKTHINLKPKSDIFLFYCIANLLIQNKHIDQHYIENFTNSFDQFKNFVAEYNIKKTSQITGLTEEQIISLTESIAKGKRVSFWWTMGVNQSHQGVSTAQAIINLALMTGNIGKPGTGANSITGQCNAMGSRLFSNTTNLFGGHSFESEVDRKKIADILEIPVENIPSKMGYSYDKILNEIDNGKIKGLWVICTNPAHSWINKSKYKKIIAKLDYLVVQDMYHDTETALDANLILPAAAWGEKEGTFINSERRIGLIKKVKHAPGQALADFYIFKLIASYWGCEDLFHGWDSPEDVFKLMAKVSKGMPCDFSAIQNYVHIDQKGGIQWPYRSEEEHGGQERRLFENNLFYHHDGKAKFVYEAPSAIIEETSEKFPFVLLTGRGSSAQWHTHTRTRNSEVLAKLHPSNIYVEINPKDANQLSIAEGEWIKIKSLRGNINAQALITSNIAEKQIFIPMHYKEVNELTLDSFDPYSRQPNYKHCAVNITKK